MVHICPKKSIFRSGFTLIELLIVVSIILLVTGSGIAGFVRFNDRQQVQTTVKEIQALMRSAQIKARSGEGANECGGTNKLKGYEVATEADAVVLNKICVTQAGVFVSSVERTRVDLSNSNVTITAAPNNSITFLALRGGVDLEGAVNITYTITGNFSSEEYQFQVLNTGELKEGAFVP